MRHRLRAGLGAGLGAGLALDLILALALALPLTTAGRTCAMSTFSVTAAHTSIECLPLGTISGSTMGTSPFFCSGC